ncbi:MAG: hypothetical protein QOK45_691 [Mycobacterium sp.]|nr:hypothetical protein [Mycobacterium sp.]
MQLLDRADREIESVERGFEVAVTRCRLVGRVLGGVDDDVGATLGGERAAAGREVAGDHCAHAVGLEHEDDCQADGPTADDDGDVFLADLGPLNGMPADRHRLGERGMLGRQAVGHGQCH